MSIFKEAKGRTLYRMMSISSSLVSITRGRYPASNKTCKLTRLSGVLYVWIRLRRSRWTPRDGCILESTTGLSTLTEFRQQRLHRSLLSTPSGRISYLWLLPPTPWQQRWVHWLWWCLEWCLDADIALSLVTFAPLSVQFSKHLLGLYLRWL